MLIISARDNKNNRWKRNATKTKTERGNTFVNTFENNYVNCMCLRQLLWFKNY